MSAMAQSVSIPKKRSRSSQESGYQEELLAKIEKAIRARARELARQGQSLDDIGPAEDVAKLMVRAIPQPSSPWSSVVGPVFVTNQLCRILGISRQALADRCRRGTLLCLKTADGHNVYPVFQFNDQHRVLPGLAEVLQTFDRSTVDDWTLAGWLLSEFDALDGRSIIDAVRAGDQHQQVVALAREQADRYAR